MYTVICITCINLITILIRLGPSRPRLHKAPRGNGWYRAYILIEDKIFDLQHFEKVLFPWIDHNALLSKMTSLYCMLIFVRHWWGIKPISVMGNQIKLALRREMYWLPSIVSYRKEDSQKKTDVYFYFRICWYVQQSKESKLLFAEVLSVCEYFLVVEIFL